VIIHDANREFERKWQDKHLAALFEGPVKGGSRCHLWIRKNMKKPVAGVSEPAQDLAQISQASRSEAPECSGTPKRPEGLGTQKTGKLIKVVSTARGWGGCARSVTTIMDLLLKAGHKVEFIPFRETVGSREYQEWLRQHAEIRVRLDFAMAVAEACDVLFVYADDYVWEFKTQAVSSAFEVTRAQKKIMMVNYRLGDIGKIPWTRQWTGYVFLNHTQEAEFWDMYGNPSILPVTYVLPPCTILEPFYKVNPVFDGRVRLVRHSSQGDTKFAKDCEEELQFMADCREEDVQIDMLPGPSFLSPDILSRVRRHPRTADPEVIASFLSLGNLFWYSLPPLYMDMGPRVILEAMAAGLPVLADNWGGAVDRVTAECGWLCDWKYQMLEIVKNVTMEDLKKKGAAARERAWEQFDPRRYIDILTR